MVNKLLLAARTKVIISEPVRNLSSSDNSIAGIIAKRMANPGTGNKVHRFTESSFRTFFEKYYGAYIEKLTFISGGREMLVILRKA